MGLAARAFFADSKAASVDVEGESEGEDDGAGEAVTLVEFEGRLPALLSGPVPFSTDHTKMTNPQRIETPRTSTPARITQPFALAERISTVAMTRLPRNR